MITNIYANLSCYFNGLKSLKVHVHTTLQYNYLEISLGPTQSSFNLDLSI